MPYASELDASHTLTGISVGGQSINGPMGAHITHHFPRRAMTPDATHYVAFAPPEKGCQLLCTLQFLDGDSNIPIFYIPGQIVFSLSGASGSGLPSTGQHMIGDLVPSTCRYTYGRSAIPTEQDFVSVGLVSDVVSI